MDDDEALQPPAAEDDEEAPIPVPPKAKTMTAKKVLPKIAKK